MIYKKLFKKIHKPILNKLCCNKKYPWGWMPSDYINNLKHTNKINHYKILYTDLDTHYYEYDFCEGAKHAYNTIFDYYNNDKNFLEESFTSPSLSLGINYLISQKNIKNLEHPNIKEIRILDDWLEENYTFNNYKILGMWNNNEIEHSILAGVIGPEINYIWSQNPIKQIVKVNFICENREDVWLFERCLFEQNPQWQIKNINNIIIE
jgi:hypothetical protein